IDLAAEGQSLGSDEIEHMYAQKTGALIHAAAMSACLLKNDIPAPILGAIDRFSHSVGIAFQIRDDILDIEGETEVIGKPAGSDAGLAKATYPGQFGLPAARARCDELLREALGELDVLSDSAESLRWLARYIVDRHY
ncbi:MAG TPA: polyprenyl synthetase family protein, partial [Woeseiaceae bacterium]|nr:polyprenyl synthetase family protein [Woeseiaceae bacterium]